MVHGSTGSDNRPVEIVKRHENVKPGKEDKRRPLQPLCLPVNETGKHVYQWRITLKF